MIIVTSKALIGRVVEDKVSIEYNNEVITSIEVNTSLAPTIKGTLIPGFVDIHAHGGGGYYFSASNPDQISKVIETHRKCGTTSMLASLVSEPIENLLAQIKTLQPFINQGTIKGIHLEGPYLAHSHCGVHNPELLRKPTINELKKLIDASSGNIRMITIAPELEGAISAIEYLVDQKITVALGHSGADAVTTRTAIAAGATIITHFNNGMPKLDTGENISSASLADPTIALELILDNVHVNEDSVQRVLNAAPNRIIAITDAMSAAGAQDGTYSIGNLEVRVKSGVARLTSNNALAGSTLTMDRAFLNLVNNFGVSITDASYACSTLPTDRIGLKDVGSIEVGKRADFVELTPDGRITLIS